MIRALKGKVNMTARHHHVAYEFQSESTLYSCLNVKELLAWNRPHIWNLSDSKGIQTHKHLVRIQILNNLAKLAKWWSCCEYLSVRCIWLYVSIMSHTSFRMNLHSIVAWMSKAPCSKQVPYLTFKWQQQDSNPQPLSL